MVDEKVCSEFIIVHSGSGQNVKFSNQMIFVGGKNPDKSVLAALTTSMNYMLRDLLLIPRIDGQPEIDNRKSDAISSSSASFRQKKAPDILNETAKELPKAPSWMVNSFSLVLGQKDDPKDFAARLLSAAVSKYDKPFDRVDDLPEEYLRRVFEHHGWVISVEDQKVRKESEDAK